MGKEIPGIYNWSEHEGPTTPVRSPRPKVDIDDETLRDGLQGVQLETHPTIEGKKIYLINAAQFIEHADIGYAGSSEASKQEIAELIHLVIAKNLPITLSVAGRTSVPSQEDIKPIVDLSHQFDGYPLEADIFWDASKYRAEIHGWKRKKMLEQIGRDINFLKRYSLPIMFVPERATDTPPGELKEVLHMVADLGVDRIGIADTTGVADEDAMKNILRFSFEEIGKHHPELKWDFHGHRDSDNVTANCATAANEGIDRVHATIFSFGERSGNADLIIVSERLNRKGFRNDNNLSDVTGFANLISDVFHYPIPPNTPVYGANAFATASGIHASAINREQLDDREHRIYFPVPPSVVGGKPRVEVGPFSGVSNVHFKLRELGIPETPEIVTAVLDSAKQGRGIMSDLTIRGIAQSILENGFK